jgi:hypothetical protein
MTTTPDPPSEVNSTPSVEDCRAGLAQYADIAYAPTPFMSLEKPPRWFLARSSVPKPQFMSRHRWITLTTGRF